MSLDAIRQVTEAEEQARRRKAEAIQTGKKFISDAQRAGEAAVETARERAQAQAQALLVQAQEDALRESEAYASRQAADCQALKDRAGARLEETAAMLARKVVEL